MSQFSYDVGLDNFEAAVLQPSREVPVVVDFWAPWCQPCQTLKPLLEKLAEEYAGRFLLAKINADENPEISRQFGVRSIPTVKVVFEGHIVDEFTGALPEAELRAFIERIAPSPGDALREEAAALAAEGKTEEALACLVHASQVDPHNEAVRLDGVELLLTLDRREEAEALLASDFVKLAERAEALRKRIALADVKIDTAALDARLAANPDDHAARLERSRACAGGGNYREALEDAMEVVRRDRFFEEGAGRKAMLELFALLAGSEANDDLVREYRRALSAALN
ncbi:MAG: tetratricopeptide repeat protein [Rhodocyclaceae bacterium]|nr:tetratricopeptide repeat protein [Rhodocyclaceae bacterium]